MIALEYNNTTQRSDLVRDGGNIGVDETLETSVFVSIFTRRLALEDDDLPEPFGHREGWWADPYADHDLDRIGSRLWLLRRSKTTQRTLNLAKSYIEEALQWMVDDGVAESINVIVERQDDMLAFKVEVLKPTKPASRWEGFWNAHLEDL